MNRTFVCIITCLAIVCGCSDSVVVSSRSMAEHFDAYCVMTGGTLDTSSRQSSIYGVCNCAGHLCVDSGCTADGLNCNTAERRMCKEGATRCVNVPDETGTSIGHLQRCEDGQFHDHERCVQVSCHYDHNNEQDNGVCGECIDHKLQCSDDGIVNCENGILAYTVESCQDKRGCVLKDGIPQCASCDSSSEGYCANGFMNRCIDGHYVQEPCPSGSCLGTTQCGNCHDGDTACQSILDLDGSGWFYRSTCIGGEFKAIQEADKPLFLTALDSVFYDNAMCNPCTAGSSQCIQYNDKNYSFLCQSDGSYHFESICDQGCDGDHCKNEPEPQADFCETRKDGVYCDSNRHIIRCKNKTMTISLESVCGTIGEHTFSCKDLESTTAKACDKKSCTADGACGVCTDGLSCDGQNMNVCEQGVLTTNTCAGGCELYLGLPKCMGKAKVKINSLPLRLTPQWHYPEGQELKDHDGNLQKVGNINKDTDVAVIGCSDSTVEGTSKYCLFKYDFSDKLKYFYIAANNLVLDLDKVDHLNQHEIYISTTTPNYDREPWKDVAFGEGTVFSNGLTLLSLMDVLCVLKENKNNYKDCSYYKDGNASSDAFNALIKTIKSYNQSCFGSEKQKDVRNEILCPMLETEFQLACDYWNLQDNQYISLQCDAGKCTPKASVEGSDRDGMIQRMVTTLEQDGYIIAKLNNKQADNSYWGKYSHSLVIYGIDMNAHLLFIDDPSLLRFSDTFDSFFKRNVDLFFVTKE